MLFVFWLDQRIWSEIFEVLPVFPTSISLYRSNCQNSRDFKELDSAPIMTGVHVPHDREKLRKTNSWRFNMISGDDKIPPSARTSQSVEPSLIVALVVCYCSLRFGTIAEDTNTWCESWESIIVGFTTAKIVYKRITIPTIKVYN